MEYIFVLLLLVSRALGDACVTYTFEDDYDLLFASNTGVCAGFETWDVGRFEDADLTEHKERSTSFIYPQQELSCVTSFTFPMSPGGVVEVNTFMESAVNSDLIQVMVMEYVPGGYDAFVAQATNTPAHAAYEPGWHTLVIPVFSYNANMTGYISVWGDAASTSTVLIDSFRYIPPGTEENECIIYPSVPSLPTESTTTTDTEAEETTEVTSETTTPETTTAATTTAATTTAATTTAKSTVIETTVTETTVTDTTIAETTLAETTVTDTTIAETTVTETTVADTTAAETTAAETTTGETTIYETTADSTTTSTVTITTGSSANTIDSTMLPTTLPPTEPDESFWTPFRIKLAAAVVALILVILILSLSACCCCSNSKVSVVVVKP